MGGTCISKSKKKNQPRKNLYIENTPMFKDQQSINNPVQPQNPQIKMSYPYYCPSWQSSIKSTQSKHTNYVQSIDKLIKIFNNQQTHQPMFCVRSFKSKHQDMTKNFRLSKAHISNDDNLKNLQLKSQSVVRSNSFQSTLFAPKLCPKMQTSISSQSFIGIDVANSQFSDVSWLNQALSPNNIYFIEVNAQKFVFRLFKNYQQVNKIYHKQLSKLKKISLANQCFFNGLLFVKPINDKGETLNNHQIKQNMSTILYQNKFIEIGSKIVCYINPLIFSRQDALKQHMQDLRTCKTYLQFKSSLQCEDIAFSQIFNIQNILKGNYSELLSIYLSIFCLKNVMANEKNSQSFPLDFFVSFFQIKSQQKQIFKKVVKTMKLGFLLSSCHQSVQDNEKIANQCCNQVFKLVCINTHLLIDAYYHQFSIQINQNLFPIRHNSMIQIACCQNLFHFARTIKPNYQLVNQLRKIWIKNQFIFVQYLNVTTTQKQQNYIIQGKINQFQKQWVQKVINYVQTNINIKVTDIIKISTIDSLVIQEYIFRIKLFTFCCYSQKVANIFKIQKSVENASSFFIENIRLKWQILVDQFVHHSQISYCSGELALTFLSIQCLVKLLKNQSQMMISQQINKCIDIWFRMNKDPRSKFNSYLTDYWLIFLIRIAQMLMNSQQAFYSQKDLQNLKNMRSCLLESKQQQNCMNILWVLQNLPICHISGIFYNKNDIMASYIDEFSVQTNSINDHGDSSVKSNYSDSFSNKNSNVSQTRKRKRNQKSAQKNINNQAIKNGLYVWGKGVRSFPLLYSITKNLQVFKISCGNYHAVIATAVGIYGWGDNGSGQLGQPTSKQSVKIAKLIMQRQCSQKTQIQISCGNQHSAILIKGQNLLMFGQKQCGIISGDGHKFDLVKCGGLHSLGILNGKVFSWGRGQGGQLGHKFQDLKTKVKKQSTDFYIDYPKLIPNLPPIKKCVCGDAHSVMLSQQGQVFVFGFSYQGQLGLGLTGDSDIFQIFQPIKLSISNKTSSNLKVIDIYAGSTFTFFKTIDGDIYSCGLNDCNQLALQKMMKVFHKKKLQPASKKQNQEKMGQIQFSVPNRVQVFNNQMKVKSIYCGQNHCLATIQYLNGSMVMGWGLNKSFQISSQFEPQNITPRTIDNLYEYGFQQICCGNNFSLGLIKNKSFATLKDFQLMINKILQQLALIPNI